MSICTFPECNQGHYPIQSIDGVDWTSCPCCSGVNFENCPTCTEKNLDDAGKHIKSLLKIIRNSEPNQKCLNAETIDGILVYQELDNASAWLIKQDEIKVFDENEYEQFIRKNFLENPDEPEESLAESELSNQELSNDVEDE